ncbi:hypothetical protein O9G_000331, partial [Rozella allomycis CSF55]
GRIEEVADARFEAEKRLRVFAERVDRVKGGEPVGVLADVHCEGNRVPFEGLGGRVYAQAVGNELLFFGEHVLFEFVMDYLKMDYMKIECMKIEYSRVEFQVV